MIRLPTATRLAGLLLAALVAAGCGPATPPPTAAPSSPAPAAPTPADATPGYPAPAELPTPGYPPPPTADPNPSPYPAPTQSGAAPGDTASAPPGAPAAGVVGSLFGGIQAQTPATRTPVARVRAVAAHPHDPWAYTQGLVYIGDDTFYEGTGNWDQSSLREVDLATGAVARQRLLSDVLPPEGQEYAFGEGVAVVGQRIFQLTWQEGRGVVYDLDFNPVGQFTYPPPGRALPIEGWGLTYDPASNRLIMSDGTANLYFVDPAATIETGVLAITGQVEVRDDLGPLTRLNELELVGGEILANLYLDVPPGRSPDWIARIDPATGRVSGYLDLSELRARLPVDPSRPHPEALNGIAYDAAGDRLFVTGKYWPGLFEIDLPVARAFLPLAAIVPPALPRLWS